MRFAGYAAVFDRVDAGGDVIRPGAFAGVRAPLPLLWSHEAGRSVGRIDMVREDRRGLRVIGTVSDPRAAALLAEGRIEGLSFGYRVVEAEGAGPRELKALQVVEVSLVRWPMQRLARVHAVDQAAASSPGSRSLRVQSSERSSLAD